MPQPPRKTVEWSGSTENAVRWDTLVSMLDALVGANRRHLPAYPDVIGNTNIRWADEGGNEFQLDRLDELRQPYESGRTGRIAFYNSSDTEEAQLVYWPGDPRPRVRARLTAESEKVSDRMTVIAGQFPAPFEGAVVFVSWGGDSSRGIAEKLHEILKAHFPYADVFFSPVSIDIGEDPLIEMFEKHLSQAQALVAVLTTESALRPWVVLEIATVWARKKLVAALFVDEDIPGPLKLKVQGVSIRDRDRVDRACQIARSSHRVIWQHEIVGRRMGQFDGGGRCISRDSCCRFFRPAATGKDLSPYRASPQWFAGRDIVSAARWAAFASTSCST